jgi:hypothetical protein
VVGIARPVVVRGFAALLAFALLLGGCSSRERDNPFDPGNPDTGGRPSGFVAIAEFSSVRLQWDRASSPALLGYRIHRRVGAGEFVPITGLLSVTTDRFQDLGLTNGVTYEYRLSFEFDSGPGLYSALDHATPGALQPWVADYGARRLVRVSADGRRFAATFVLDLEAQPIDLDVDRFGRVWAPSPSGVLYVLQPSDTSLRRGSAGLQTPVSVAVDPGTGHGWVGDEGRDEIRRFAADGAPLSGTIAFVRGPTSLALHPGDRTLWAVENEADRVRHFDPDGFAIAAGVQSAPSRVAVDSLTGDAWATSVARREVRRFSASGAELAHVEFGSPVGIAVDWRRRRVWVADRYGGTLTALHVSGDVERVFEIGGEPFDVAVDLATGNVWVVLQAARELRCYAPDGAERSRVGGFASPAAVALDPGPRAAPGP